MLVTGVQQLYRAAALDLSTSHLPGDRLFCFYVFIHSIFVSVFLIFVRKKETNVCALWKSENNLFCDISKSILNKILPFVLPLGYRVHD